MTIVVEAVPGVPEVAVGSDLAQIACDALASADFRPPAAGDVVVFAQKIVSKAEGMLVELGDVQPSPRAVEIAAGTERDPRVVQVVLDESRAVLRERAGTLICETHHGFVCANAGVDASNVPADDCVLLLPRDADASARALRAALERRFGAPLGVVITDSFGRAWRVGQADVAIGCAGLMPVRDARGEADRDGRLLAVTEIAVADEIAAAADLARDKASGEPLVLVRGLERFVTNEDGPGAAALLRDISQDMFR